LTRLNLADKYEGETDVTGEDYNVEYTGDGSRPFRAFLDVGLTRTTTGNKVFAAMKGALDGGLDIPHR
jgi:large subunit ribosomal protein L5e